MLHAAPITHGSGAFFLPHLVKGAANVVVAKFSPSAFLEAAQKHRATMTFMVPTMISMLLEDPATATADLTLERLCYGGAPIATSVLQRGLDARSGVRSALRAGRGAAGDHLPAAVGALPRASDLSGQAVHVR
jgi:acyl-CoA synthetase (AMP-forming)/AMP-acid ligase II